VKFVRRSYEVTALVAVRQTRELVLFWARRCRKSTTLGSIAFDEMSGHRGRSVIAASASLLLGKELVSFALTSAEQAAVVLNEAAAVRTVLEGGADGAGLQLTVANSDTGKAYAGGLCPEDFAALYKSSNLEFRLYFDRTSYSRLKIIAPNPATARGWAGTVLRDEAGYTPAALETALRVATKPIMDTDPTFKLIYACNLCPDDRHPFFEMTMPAPDAQFPVNPNGNFYHGQDGVLIHRVTLADAYAAGHVLYDSKGQPLTLEQFRAQPGNKLGLNINYDLVHQSGGTAAIDLIALLTAQARGAGQCHFAFVDSDTDYLAALNILRGLLRNGRVGIGFDVATTTGETSNPSAITVTEQLGPERLARLVMVFKSKKRQVMVEKLQGICRVIAARPQGGPARRLCIDATSERLAAEETADDLRAQVPVELVIASMAVQPVGYDEPTNYKTYLGDLYSIAVNENRYALPSSPYIKQDQRLTLKDQGRYVCTPDADGKHGDTFDSGKLAEWALVNTSGAFTTAAGISVGAAADGRKTYIAPRMQPCAPRR